MPRVEAIVFGNVQGVGYRDFVSRVAASIGVNGFVRNLPNGTVEVVAEGGKEEIKELLHSLEQGPSLSCVSGVKTSWSDKTEGLKGFSIKY